MIGVPVVMRGQDDAAALGGERETSSSWKAIRASDSEFAGLVLPDVEVFDWSY